MGTTSADGIVVVELKSGNAWDLNVEQGTDATPWTPAPEDINGNVRIEVTGSVDLRGVLQDVPAAGARLIPTGRTFELRGPDWAP